jgi:hypothetical protein
MVSLFSQKIKQEGSVLAITLRERGAAKQEVIYILEEFTQGEMKGKEVPSQSLAKEVGTIPESLRQGSIVGKYEYLVSPGEGKKVLGLQVDRDSKESIF